MFKNKIKKELVDFVGWADQTGYLTEGKSKTIFLRVNYSKNLFLDREDNPVSLSSIKFVKKKGPVLLTINKNLYVVQYHSEPLEKMVDYFSVYKMNLPTVKTIL